MLSESIRFTYLLHAANLNVPVPIGATLNGTVVDTAVIAVNGKFEFAVDMELSDGDANIALTIGELSGSTITVTSVKLTWVKDNSSLDPHWLSKPGPNEVWHYNAPELEKVIGASRSRLKFSTILLEYETDERKSFLRNNALVESGGEQFSLQNAKGFYAFKAPGSFTLPMTSPVSYWLLQHLFVSV
jgi:hypothetical protein